MIRNDKPGRAMLPLWSTGWPVTLANGLDWFGLVQCLHQSWVAPWVNLGQFGFWFTVFPRSSYRSVPVCTKYPTISFGNRVSLLFDSFLQLTCCAPCQSVLLVAVCMHLLQKCQFMAVSERMWSGKSWVPILEYTIIYLEGTRLRRVCCSSIHGWRQVLERS